MKFSIKTEKKPFRTIVHYCYYCKKETNQEIFYYKYNKKFQTNIRITKCKLCKEIIDITE